MRTILTTLIVVALALYLRSAAPYVTKPTVSQIAEFTNNASITLPVSAQPVGWHEERGMDDALWLQVKMPASDLNSFLDSSPFRHTTLTTNFEYIIYMFWEFYTTPPVRYRAGQQSLPKAQALNMLIDETNTTNLVMYLMWHET